MTPSSIEPRAESRAATQLASFFYPVAQSRDLRDKPIERRVNGRTIALFRDGGGLAVAFDAACPHHGANLADGQVVDGCLACPYHGWRFAADGHCVLIPSHPDRRIPSRAAAVKLNLVEQQGLIWVHAGPGEPLQPPPRLPFAEDPGFRAFTVEERMPGPADWWLDNLMDISHVPFVHRDSFGGRRTEVQPGPVERRADELGFSSSVVVRYEYGLLARLIHGTVSAYTENVRFDVTVPATVHADIDMGGGRRQVLAMLATPEDDATTRVFIVVWRNYLKWAPGGDRLGRRFTRRILFEDRRIVERSLVTLRSAEQSAMAADGSALELVRLLRLWREREAEAAGPVDAIPDGAP